VLLSANKEKKYIKYMKNKVDIKFIDTSSWQNAFWLNNGGTRSKKVLQDLDGKIHYFKCSEKKEAKEGKPEKYYKYEFYNEIIAYQLGKNLGLDILRYDIGVYKDEIGCLSPNLLEQSTDTELLEVGRFMTAINPSFLPELNDNRKLYTFQLLVETLDKFKLNNYLPCFFDTLVFDALIGNTDRHQENWAFIGKHTFVTQAFLHVENEVKEKGFHKLNWIVKKLYNRFIDKEKNEFSKKGKEAILETISVGSMAPIYDSGSSLGRELENDKVNTYLEDEVQLENYMNKGLSELHWNRKKLSHFNLIKELMQSSYHEMIFHSLENILTKYDKKWIEDILLNIDISLPEAWSHYRIPENRKQFIIKLVTLRHQKLREIFENGGV
jgi:hypothetical protein